MAWIRGTAPAFDAALYHLAPRAVESQRHSLDTVAHAVLLLIDEPRSASMSQLKFRATHAPKFPMTGGFQDGKGMIFSCLCVDADADTIPKPYTIVNTKGHPYRTRGQVHDAYFPGPDSQGPGTGTMTLSRKNENEARLVFSSSPQVLNARAHFLASSLRTPETA
jgi:hypothetical protein